MQAKANCFFCSFVNTFEVAWFGYGNYLFFFEGNESDFEKSDNLRQTMIVILIWGYIVTGVYLLSLCFIGLLLYGMWQYGIFDSQK